MSECIIRTAPPLAVRETTDGLVARINRLSLGWLSQVEAALQARRDQHNLSTMSDRELADIGIGRSEIQRALRDGRGAREAPLSRAELAAVAQMRMGGWL